MRHLLLAFVAVMLLGADHTITVPIAIEPKLPTLCAYHFANHTLDTALTVDQCIEELLIEKFRSVERSKNEADSEATRNTDSDAFDVDWPTALDEAVCGDGEADAGETCDDGNRIDGDGCSSRCTIE